MKNKTIALLLAVLMIMALVPATAVLAASPSVEVVLPSNTMKAGDVGQAKVYVKSAEFILVGVCLTFDEETVQLVRKTDTAVAATTAAQPVKVNNEYDADEDTGVFNKVGEASKLFTGAISMTAMVYQETTNAMISADGTVTADADGLLLFTVYFKMLKDGDPAIKVGTVSGDADFGSSGSQIDGESVSAKVSYTAYTKPEDPVDPDVEAAKAVDDKITALGTITLEKKAAVAAARTAYDALSAAAKAKVTKLAVLEAAEAKIVELETPVDTDKEAKAFEALVAKISDKLTVSDIAAIEAAQTAYGKLAAADKAKVSAASIAKYEAAVKALANLKAAKEVIAKIDAIGEVTVAKETAIKAARTAYNALSASAKAYVTNLDKLTAAEAKLAELKAAAEADEATKLKNVEAAIDALDKTASYDKAEDIKAAQALYDALTDAQKAKINKTKAAKLTKLSADLAAIEKTVEEYVPEITVTDATGLFTVDTSKALAALYTAEDKAIVANGGTVKFEIKIAAATASEELSAKAAGQTAIGAYSFDVVRIANGTESAATMSGTLPVKYAVEEKYELLSSDLSRVFSVYFDNGTVSALKDTDSEDYTFSAALGSSGTLLVAYKDIENPKTGDAFVVYAFAMMAVLTFAAVVVIRRKRIAE